MHARQVPHHIEVGFAWPEGGHFVNPGYQLPGIIFDARQIGLGDIVAAEFSLEKAELAVVGQRQPLP